MSGVKLANAFRDLEASVYREQGDALEDRPVQRVQPEPERGGDPKVGAGAAQAPEKVGIALFGHIQRLRIGRDEASREEIITRGAEAP